MPLSDNKLTQTAIVKYQVNTPDAYGEINEGYTTLYTDLKCRKVNNKKYNLDAQSESGYLSSSTHLIFMNLFSDTYPDIMVKLGYIIVISGESYVVQYSDRSPGGRGGHHQQIYVSHQLKAIG